MSTECARLHELIRSLKRYDFSDYDRSKIPSNSIQVLFQKNENGHQLHRIVMIGTKQKINDYIPQNAASEPPFAVYIKRALKVANNPKYSKEQSRDYVLDNFYFHVLDLDVDKKKRNDLKKKMIATVAQCKDCGPSSKWPGLHYPEMTMDGEDITKTGEKIKKAGLWQVNHTTGNQTPLDSGDLEHLAQLIQPKQKRMNENTDTKPATPQEFRFKPGFRESDLSTTARSSEKEIVIRQRHHEMQKRLYNKLAGEYGTDNVGTEISRVDLVVQQPEGYWFYEIKTADTAKACIREALGQLLEYSYWPGNKQATCLIIVGEPKLDAAGRSYIRKLQKEFGLPLDYESI